jgi:long-chain acyl-CoA synthetase
VAVDFWALDHSSNRLAVLDADGRRFTYAQLRDGCDHIAPFLPSSRKTFGFVLCRNTSECLIAYLSALRSGSAVCLMEAGLQPEIFEEQTATYEPDWVFAMEQMDITGYSRQAVPGGFVYYRQAGPSVTVINPELAVLLPTSGSTGSSKLVKLTYRNLQANAASIITYLGITAEDRCITALPMPYSYGLSVLNTHLLAGGQLAMTAGSVAQREFWTFFREHRPTSLSGVPYHYEIMLRSGLLDSDFPGLKTLTQAGGRLSPERIEQVAKIADRRGWRFFVMYGQTEATARIAYLSPERLRDKIGSIGVAIPGGALSLDPETGELLYSGPNVMLGYAQSRADLSKGDEVNGQLRTGDLARMDEEGYFYITGRLKRFLKIFGRRFGLDEMESLISHRLGQVVACFGKDDQLSVAIERESSEQVVLHVLKETLKIHPSAFRIQRYDALPRMANGKIDYNTLARQEQAP